MLENKVALITGGALGIGRSIALELANKGCDIAVNYRTSDKEANELVSEIKKLGRNAVAIQSDISDFNNAKELVEQVIKQLGNLNILVNNAGITRDSLFIRMKEEDFDLVLNTNLKGVFNVTKHATRHLIRQEHARIINISSVSGLKGNVGQVNYSAAKAGVIGFTKSLSKELATRGVTVNVVAPGFIETQMTDVLSENIKEQVIKEIPLKSFGKPEDIAKAVAFLASNDAKYITGHTLVVDGGLSVWEE